MLYAEQFTLLKDVKENSREGIYYTIYNKIVDRDDLCVAFERSSEFN